MNNEIQYVISFADNINPDLIKAIRGIKLTNQTPKELTNAGLDKITVFGMALKSFLPDSLRDITDYQLDLQNLHSGIKIFIVNGIPLAASVEYDKLNELCGCDLHETLTSLKVENIEYTRRRKGNIPIDLNDISPLYCFTKLRNLTLSSDASYSDISPLGYLINLESLTIGGIGGSQEFITDIRPLSQLTKLRTLTLKGFRSLADITPLKCLINMEEFTLSAYPKCYLTDITPLANLTGLRELRLRDCFSLTDIGPLANLRNLRLLDLSGCCALNNISPLKSLTRLRTLFLIGCTFLKDISQIAVLNGIQELHMVECPHLNSEQIRQLSQLDNLRRLVVDDPVASSNVFLKIAARRKDITHCTEHALAAINTLQASKDYILAVPISEAIAVAGDRVAKTALENFLSICLEIPGLDDESWRTILKSVWNCSRPTVPNWLRELSVGRVKVATAGVLFNLTAGLLDWVATGDRIEEAASILDNLPARLTKGEQIELGPRICLAWRVLGKDNKAKEWLARLTTPGDTSFRDRILAVYALADVSHGHLDKAAGILKEIKSGTEADKVRATLAKAYAAKAPEQAGELLDQIMDEYQKHQVAEELSENAGFTNIEANIMRLLAILGTDQQKMLDIIGKTSVSHPDNVWLSGLRQIITPPSDIKNLLELIYQLYDHPAVIDVTKPKQLQALKERLECNNDMWHNIINQVGLELLRSEGLISKEEALQVAAAMHIPETAHE